MTEPSAEMPRAMIPYQNASSRKFLAGIGSFSATPSVQSSGQVSPSSPLLSLAKPTQYLPSAEPALYFGLKLESGGSFGNDDIAGSIDGYLSAV